MHRTLSTICKQCPLLLSVILASVILMIVFSVQKADSTASSATQANAEIALETTAPAAAAPNQSEDSAAATESAPPADSDNASLQASALGAVTTTETIPPETDMSPQFQRVESDAYFNDALFIGNSRTVGLYMFGSLPKEATFYATVGMNLYDLLTSTAQVPPEEGPETSFTDLLSSRSFGKIYIMLGINDLGTGTSESFAAYYADVIAQIRQMQPNAIIYIQSIINISAQRDAQGDCITNSSINEKNGLIQNIANNRDIFYLNVNEVLVDENGFLNADYTSDGVHLGGGSLSLWENYLRDHAILTAPDTASDGAQSIS